jgi:hypothetical protein
MRHIYPLTIKGIILGDLFENLTQSQPSPEPEKRCIKHLLGIVSRGVFQATREEMQEIMLSEHEAKIEGLARHVLAKPKKDREPWLLKFEDIHGRKIADDLRGRIIEMYQTNKDSARRAGA